VKLLLDTHIFLWLVTGDQRMSLNHRHDICDPANEVYLSVAAVWEATVKHQLGKLTLPEAPERYLPSRRQLHNVASLPLDEASILRLPSLPLRHRDPFDRMMICQALEHGMTIVTVDTAIKQYQVPVLP
jgi:PIN domain nuclease of toxin-antitoxin system